MSNPAQAALLTRAPAFSLESRLHRVIFALLIALCAAVFLLELTIGVVWIPPDQVVTILSGGEPARASWTTIVRDVRLPRALAAIIAGSAIGVAGLLLQTLFRNPLADPWILGVVHGARLGVAVLIVAISAGGTQVLNRLGAFGDIAFAASAAAGATVVVVLLLSLSSRVGAVTLLILGLMAGFSCQGLISVVLHFTDEGHVIAFRTWDDGNFGAATYAKLRVFFMLILTGLALGASVSKQMNAFLLGENYARSMGVRIRSIRLAALVATAILAGTVTAFCGPIAFLGILAPHAARALLRSQDHRLLVPAVMLLGAAFALAADLLVHLPWSRHFLHLNAVIGLFGGPLIFWTIVRDRRGKLLDS